METCNCNCANLLNWRVWVKSLACQIPYQTNIFNWSSIISFISSTINFYTVVFIISHDPLFTGILWGESIDHQGFFSQRTSKAEYWCFHCCCHDAKGHPGNDILIIFKVETLEVRCFTSNIIDQVVIIQAYNNISLIIFLYSHHTKGVKNVTADMFGIWKAVMICFVFSLNCGYGHREIVHDNIILMWL